MTYSIELSVNINPIAAELASDFLLNELGCSGVVMEEIGYKDEEIISEVKNIVKGYLLQNLDKPFVEEKIQQLLFQKKEELREYGISEENLGSWKLTTAIIEDEEWAHNWKKYWHPMQIGEKIVICPSWEEYEIKNNEIKIELDPGSAFGTGTHPTTRLCVIALEKYVKSGDKLADVGTGSGILAIAGIKLGVESAVGVDNAASAIPVAVENAQKNNIENKISFYEGSAQDITGQYEIVTANILAHVLIDIMDDLKNLVKKDGKLILSGIIAEKEQDVIVSAQSQGLKYIETLSEENWVAIVMSA